MSVAGSLPGAPKAAWRGSVIERGQVSHLPHVCKPAGSPDPPFGPHNQPGVACALRTPPSETPVGAPRPLRLAHASCVSPGRGVTCPGASVSAGELPVTAAAAAARGPRESRAVRGEGRPRAGPDSPRGMPRTRPRARGTRGRGRQRRPGRGGAASCCEGWGGPPAPPELRSPPPPSSSRAPAGAPHRRPLPGRTCRPGAPGGPRLSLPERALPSVPARQPRRRNPTPGVTLRPPPAPRAPTAGSPRSSAFHRRSGSGLCSPPAPAGTVAGPDG